jgi:hypothetical protein
MGRQKSNIKSYIPRQFQYNKKNDPFWRMLNRFKGKATMTLEEAMGTEEYNKLRERQSKNQG